MPHCAHCHDPRVVANLDGEDLCQRHADEWCRGEGAAAADADAETRSFYGIPASSMNGNAAQRHANPDAWDRWVAFSEANGYF